MPILAKRSFIARFKYYGCSANAKKYFEQIKKMYCLLDYIFFSQSVHKNLLTALKQKCDYFCNDIALPVKLKLGQRQNGLF